MGFSDQVIQQIKRGLRDKTRQPSFLLKLRKRLEADLFFSFHLYFLNLKLFLVLIIGGKATRIISAVELFSLQFTNKNPQNMNRVHLAAKPFKPNLHLDPEFEHHLHFSFNLNPQARAYITYSRGSNLNQIESIL